jgi:hypothetical protein
MLVFGWSTRFQALATWRALDSRRRKLHFWRDRAGHEVDFTLEEAGKLVALHSGQTRPLDADDIALPWGWMVPEPR